MAVNGAPVSYGIGAHAPSMIEFALPEGYTRFRATGALDDGGSSQADGATVEFLVFTQSPNAAKGESVTVILADMGLGGACQIRDLWAKKDLGTVQNQFEAQVAPHGAVLVKVSPANR